MNFLFAWRYFKAKKTTNAINIIAWISIVAIIIGTASLILVLSVFNGFEGLVKSLYSSFYPELKISPVAGRQITLTSQQLEQLRGVKGVKSISLVVEEKGLLQYAESDSADYKSPIVVKGVDSNYVHVTDVKAHIVQGQFNTGTEENPLLILGAGIQDALHVETDRNVKPLIIYTPRRGDINLSDPFKSLSSQTVNTSGTFLIQPDFDNKYAITNLAFVKSMLGMQANEYGAAEISLNGNVRDDDVKGQMKNILGFKYLVQNRYEQNASLYSVMRIEKWFIYAILSLILVVAAFNMVGALTMLVLEKKSDISVLHALGAKRGFIQKIFLSEGLLLAIIGGGIGMLLAFIVGVLQIKYHLVPLEGSTFMIDYFPVKMLLPDFLLVGLTVLVIALVASWLPARKASIQHMVVREE